MKTKLLITGLAIFAMTTFMNAQSSNTDQQNPAPVRQGQYVDADKDGICDNFETRGTGRGMANGQGKGMANTGRGMGRGKSPAMGRGAGMGRGRNFVDNDKNGVCDIYEQSFKK